MPAFVLVLCALTPENKPFQKVKKFIRVNGYNPFSPFITISSGIPAEFHTPEYLILTGFNQFNSSVISRRVAFTLSNPLYLTSTIRLG